MQKPHEARENIRNSSRTRLSRQTRSCRKANPVDLLDVEESACITLTENLAMSPALSVSGLFFAHPDSPYFNLGNIKKDQVEDYAQRKGMRVEEIERWLGSNLAYEKE